MVLTQRAEHDDVRVTLDAPARPRGRFWRSPWLPAAVVLVASVAVLRCYDVSLGKSGIFAVYIALGITLPGTLLWRLVHRGSRSVPEDLAAGTAIGYAVEVLTYIPARALGLPLATQLVPLAVIATFAAVPGLRRFWRGPGPDGRAPLAFAWTLAVVALLLLGWSTKYFRLIGRTWPSYGRTDIDLPFHLALTGEFKHHMDFVTPWVISEPVYYHWFVYAEMASTSWATGIEPWVLITRLTLLPMIVAYAVLVAAFGRRLIGSWWGGALTVIAAFFVLAPDPYGWPLRSFYRAYAFNVVDDGSNLRLYLWTSPTQTFGSLLFVPLMLVLLDLLRGHGTDRRRWALFALLPAAVMGAKATFLPTLFCGLLLLLAVQLVFQRRLNRIALKALGVVLFWMVFAQVVLFGGQSQGLMVSPLLAMRRNAAGATTALISDPQPWRLVVLLAMTVMCWVMIWGGVAGLRRRWAAPEVLLLAGLGIAGTAALVIGGQVGGSETYFLMGARPYVAAAATWGLVLLLPRLTRRGLRPLVGAVVAGMAVVGLVRLLDTGRVPVHTRHYNALLVTVQLIYPYAILAAVALAAGFALRRRYQMARGMSVALVVALMLGFSVPTAFRQFTYAVTDGAQHGWKERGELWPVVTEGTREAGRWLREHSSPDDLIATNAHCVYVAGGGVCDRRHLGIAGYTERRVLVESWAYTAEAHNQELVQGVPQENTMYWKPPVLIDNDAAFTTPSAATVGRLREHYHVRWLWTEDVYNWSWNDPPSGGEVPVSEDLRQFAKLRYKFGHVAIYELD
ncbi:hypothetical protein ACQP00_08680 [Dactylosporangium sp. CS-047395]|uniref:hypothetical protein n=1 Tax=Dactylosporangium sp. CS-047395 TaxID=3239936 RepID=UPI003D8DC02B